MPLRALLCIDHLADTLVFLVETYSDAGMRKLVDVSKINALGWRHRYGLAEGLAHTYRWFLEHHADARGLDG